jgi:UDP-glucose 4-epimerase
MRVLITGGAGFIGSYLAEALVARGDEAFVLDDMSTGRPENLGALAGDPRLSLVVGSILDAALVEKYVERVDQVYHLAAAVGVKLIVERPLDCLRTNVAGTEIVVEQAARYQKKLLLTSSSEIYGKNAGGPLHEDDDRILGSPLKSRWSYSTAKALDEILAYTYWKESGLPVAIARLFNAVGARQTGAYGMVIPRFVAQAMSGEPVTVYGDGSQTRCFCHVSDIVRGLIALMDEPRAEGTVVNLGSSEEISMTGLAERVIALVGSASTVAYIPYDQAYEAGFEDMQRRVPDTSRARDLIGWRPTMGLDDVIRDVISAEIARVGGLAAAP